MNRHPFQPADGISARWRKLYDLVLAKEVNDEITYREAEELLDCDRTAAQGAMLLAARHLEEAGEQSVRTVSMFGWVVMRASEHIGAADHHLTKARRQATISLRKLTAIDDRRGELSQFEREAVDRGRLRANALIELAGRSRRTLAELEQRNRQGEAREG